MMTLEERLDNIETIIQKPAFRKNKGVGTDVGYYVFDYPAEREMLIRERTKYIQKKFEHSPDNFRVVIYDLYDLVINILKEKGYLEKCFDMEKTRGFDKMSRAICNTLRLTSEDNLIVNHIKANTPDNSVVFLVGIGKCFPILRSHSVLNSLHQTMDKVPVILFYPGAYANQELILFDEVKDDNFYRANKL